MNSVDMAETTCPICDYVGMEPKIEFNRVEYRGIQREIPSLYCVCTTNGCETAKSEQVHANKVAMDHFKEEIDDAYTLEAMMEYFRRKSKLEVVI